MSEPLCPHARVGLQKTMDQIRKNMQRNITQVLQFTDQMTNTVGLLLLLQNHYDYYASNIRRVLCNIDHQRV